MALRIASSRTLLLVAAASLSFHACSRKDTPLETVAVVSDPAQVRAGDEVVATVEKGRVFGVLARRRGRVEIQVCVGTDLRRGSLLASDVKLLTDDDVDLETEWLRTARELNSQIDLDVCRARLDALIERVAAAAADGKTLQEKAHRIGIQLFEREKFSAHRRVAMPDRLLDRKQGNCFSLSLLYLLVGQRLGMPFRLADAPGHVFVRCDDAHDRFNIETTQQGSLHARDDYLREHLGAFRFSQIGGTHLVSQPAPRALGALAYEAANELSRRGRHAEACAKYATAAEIGPEGAAGYYSWGCALEQMGQHSEACAMFARAVGINPRYADAYANWGLALGQMGEHAEACAQFAKLAEIDPRIPQAYSNWGTALAKMGKPAEACRKFAQAIEINPPYAEAYNKWGLALGQMGQHAAACAKFAKAVEIRRQYAEAFANWGAALAELGQHAEACEKLARAAAIDPKDARIVSRWAGVLCSAGDYPGACEKYAKAMEIDPRFAEAFLGHAVPLAHLGRKAEAIEKIEKAAELDPTLKPLARILRKMIEETE